MPGSLIGFSFMGRSFKCAGDADGNTNIGGYENEYQSYGNGDGRYIQKMGGWKFSGISFAIDEDSDDLEFLKNGKDTGKPQVCKAEYSDGTVRSGKGNITGAIEVSSMNGTAPLTFEGPFEFKKQ